MTAAYLRDDELRQEGFCEVCGLRAQNPKEKPLNRIQFGGVGTWVCKMCEDKITKGQSVRTGP